jgi:hypothetical protein
MAEVARWKLAGWKVDCSSTIRWMPSPPDGNM